MLEIAFIRENTEVVKKAAEAKGFAINLEKLLKLDDERREMLGRTEDLRRQRNELAAKAGKDKPSATDVETGKKLKAELSALEDKLDKVSAEYKELLEAVPNIIPEDTPIGGEKDNRVEKEWGKAEKAKSKVLDHLSWGEQTDTIDFERAAKVAGNKFYYIKGQLVELEYALIQFALVKATEAGFTPVAPPHLVNSRVAAGSGFLPRDEAKQIYKVEGEDLHLIATAEMPLTGYHMDEILDAKSLPRLYAGVSPSYRVEAGAYGKHAKGLFRVHQFDKVELYVFCRAEDSEEWHQKLLALEGSICQALEIPYRVVRIASGDLGAPAYKKYDVEYWSPVDGTYRELMSCSNVTDYQARRLNIRERDGDKTGFVHTLNGTAMAFSRMAIALIENHQDQDRSLRIPKALQPYLHRGEAT